MLTVRADLPLVAGAVCRAACAPCSDWSRRISPVLCVRAPGACIFIHGSQSQSSVSRFTQNLTHEFATPVRMVARVPIPSPGCAGDRFWPVSSRATHTAPRLAKVALLCSHAHGSKVGATLPHASHHARVSHCGLARAAGAITRVLASTFAWL